MQAYVYMVRCENGTLYTGWTNDLARRLKAHQQGTGARYTRAFKAQTLAYAQQLESKQQAMQREVQLKRLSKKEKEALAASFDPTQLVLIRPATRQDAPAVLEIMSYYIQNSTASFLYQPPSLAQYQAEMGRLCRTLPFFVAQTAGGELLGYACAHPWRYGTGAYAWDAETTIYLAPQARRTGVGSRLYQALLAGLKIQGYWNAYAVLADPNPASEAFHKAQGFVCEGRQRRTGLKNGWQGISYWLLDLCPGSAQLPQAQPVQLTQAQRRTIAALAQQGLGWADIVQAVQPAP